MPIDKVACWDKNPRNIKTVDFDRLKKQILWAKDFVPQSAEEQLLLYAMMKPLIVFPENGGYTVLGGNMRLRALKELGEKEVEVSIVHPKTEAQKIQISLIDNDRAGETDEQQLAELVWPHIAEINLADYKVDLGEAVDLKSLIEGIGPDLDDKGPDEEAETENECPKCGYKWTAR